MTKDDIDIDDEDIDDMIDEAIEEKIDDHINLINEDIIYNMDSVSKNELMIFMISHGSHADLISDLLTFLHESELKLKISELSDDLKQTAELKGISYSMTNKTIHELFNFLYDFDDQGGEFMHLIENLYKRGYTIEIS